MFGFQVECRVGKIISEIILLFQKPGVGRKPGESPRNSLDVRSFKPDGKATFEGDLRPAVVMFRQIMMPQMLSEQHVVTCTVLSLVSFRY